MKKVILGIFVVITSAALQAADWPQWRGPNRDGRSAETGLLTSWPREGPRQLWTASGLGEGYSSLAIAGGRVFTQGQRGSRQYVMAFDVKTGSRLWETVAGGRFSESRGNGPRGTPTVDGTRVYAIAADGALVCLDAATGKQIWGQNMLRAFGARLPPWGISESPLVDGNRLIVAPGGRGAAVVALNKADGSLLWRSGNDEAGYSSAVVADIAGIRQIVTLTSRAVVGLRADTGQQLWRYTRVSNQTANIATPILHDGLVFASTEYESGGALLRPDARSVAEVYFTRSMRNHYSTSVLVDDVLYGFNGSILTAMRFRTGDVLWRHRSVGKGSLVYADNYLYVLGEDGTIALVEADAGQYREVSRFEIPSSRYPAWAPPAIADGRLYVRNQDRLAAYDIAAR
jgi:outer membrane protein assembly factor BamB